jgi:glycine oxidase
MSLHKPMPSLGGRDGGHLPRIAILGRGIAGLTAAYHLAKCGFNPTLFGRKQAHAQASRAAQGVLCNKGLIFYESPLFRAKLESLRSMPAFLDCVEKESGREIPRLFQGVDEPFWTEDDFQKTVSRIYRNKFWGAHRTVLSTPSPDVQGPMGYLHYPADGWFDPRALLDGLEDILSRHGVSIVDKDVESLESILQPFDVTILATGAGSAGLWPQLDCKALKMFLIGGQTLECARPSSGEQHIQVKGNLSLAVLKDRVILGSTSWPGYESKDLTADAQGLRQAININFGQLYADGLSRSGTRLRFKDRMPLVGWLNTGRYAGRIYLMTGFYRNGMHLAEICARELLYDFRNESEKRVYPEFAPLRFYV